MINTFKNLCYRKSKKTWICATGSPRKHDTYQYLYFLYAPSYLNKLGLVKGLKKFNSITLFHIFVFIEGPLIRSKNCTKRQIFFFSKNCETEAKCCILIRKNCAKVLRTKTYDELIFWPQVKKNCFICELIFFGNSYFCTFFQ